MVSYHLSLVTLYDLRVLNLRLGSDRSERQSAGVLKQREMTSVNGRMCTMGSAMAIVVSTAVISTNKDIQSALSIC